jgi:NADPH-dependent 7-cyano-7-deazaguanine reductase QueF
MSEGRELKKFIVHVELVHCPKEERIVESTVMCFPCPFFKQQDWSKVVCTYRGGEE